MPSLTRRQALRAGALGALLGAVRVPSHALAAGPSLFESELTGVAWRRSADGVRTSGVLRAPRRFDLAGLAWDAGDLARAEVRARPRGGDWSPWLGLPVAGDHAPDGAGAVRASEPAFTGPADEYELRVWGAPDGLRARFVRALPAASLARGASARLRRRAGARAAQAAVTPFPLISRREWGADAVPPRADPAYGEVQLAFVHHTVNANAYRRRDSAAIVLGIARFHRDGNGWNDIGYNLLVDRYGQVFEGRGGGVDQPVVGAQAQGYNAVSTGIACLGTFEAAAPPQAALDSLARVVGWKLSLHGVAVRGAATVLSAAGETNRHAAGTAVTLPRVCGHRDGDLTSCPGSALYRELGALRRRAARHVLPRTALTLRATPWTAAAGAAVRFGGALHAGAGAAIALERRAEGSAWAAVGAATADAAGRWELVLVPPGGGEFRAVAGEVVSRTLRVDVTPELTLALDRPSVARGGRVEVSGTVAPAETILVAVERRAGSAWRTVTTELFDGLTGAYAWRTPRLRTPGRYRVTAIAGAARRRRALHVG